MQIGLGGGGQLVGIGLRIQAQQVQQLGVGRDVRQGLGDVAGAGVLQQHGVEGAVERGRQRARLPRGGVGGDVGIAVDRHIGVRIHRGDGGLHRHHQRHHPIGQLGDARRPHNVGVGVVGPQFVIDPDVVQEAPAIAARDQVDRLVDHDLLPGGVPELGDQPEGVQRLALQPRRRGARRRPGVRAVAGPGRVPVAALVVGDRHVDIADHRAPLRLQRRDLGVADRRRTPQRPALGDEQIERRGLQRGEVHAAVLQGETGDVGRQGVILCRPAI